MLNKARSVDVELWPDTAPATIPMEYHSADEITDSEPIPDDDDENFVDSTVKAGWIIAAVGLAAIVFAGLMRGVA